MILDWLRRFGYLDPKEADKIKAWGLSGLSIILESVRAHLNLPADTSAEALLDMPRCGCPDVMPLNVEQARWRKRDLTYRVRGYLPKAIVPQSVQDDVFSEGTKDWSSKLDITFKRVAMDQPADITIFASRIDGPGRVLAQAQLPNGSDSPLWLQFDDGEQAWSTLKGSREANLHNVFRHELGHNLGHYHNPDNRALMYAMANSNIPHVTELDVQASIRLGYQRRTEPAPVPVPAPTPDLGGKMNWLDKLLRLLNWNETTWTEKVQLVADLLAGIAEYFKGKETPAPAAVSETATADLEAAIRAELPQANGEALLGGGLLEKLLPLILELIRRRLGGL